MCDHAVIGLFDKSTFVSNWKTLRLCLTCLSENV